MNLYFQAGQEVLQVIRQHKKLVLGVFFFQLLFLSAISFVFINYQVTFFKDLEQLTQGIQQIPVSDQPEVEQLLNQFLQLKEQYDHLMGNIINFLLWSFGIFLLGNGLTWSMAQYAVTKGKLHHYFLRFCVITLVLCTPLGIATVIFLKNFLSQTEFLRTVAQVLPYGLLAISYLLISGYSLLSIPLRQYPKTWWRVGIQRLHYLLPVILLTLGTVGSLLYAAYQYATTLPLLLLAAVLIIGILSFSKLYLIALGKHLQ